MGNPPFEPTEDIVRRPGSLQPSREVLDSHTEGALSCPRVILTEARCRSDPSLLGPRQRQRVPMGILQAIRRGIS